MIITDLNTLTLTIYCQILCFALSWYEQGLKAFHLGPPVIQCFKVSLLVSLNIKQY